MTEELRVKINQSLSMPFIGETVFSDDEIEEMVTDCRNAYRNSKNRYGKNLNSLEVDELVVLIVNIAKKWVDESEGRFWVKLYNEIFEDGSIQPSKFYDDYESCLKRHHHILFRSKEKKRMFRETFLLHAFAPENSSDSFIKLIWRWYSDNEILNFDYRKEEDDFIVRKFVQYLKNTFSDEADYDEDVNFEGNVYQIKSSFKYLFTQDMDAGYALLDSLFDSFNSVYRSISGNRDSFFWLRSSVVVNKILEEARVSKGTRRGRTIASHVIDDYSKIHIDYGFSSNNELVLSVPEIRAIDEVADEYFVNIYSGENLVDSIKGYVLGEGFRRKIKAAEIGLGQYSDSFLEKFDLRVEMALNRGGYKVAIYDSKQSLVRDYVLFKSSREIRSEVCNPGNYFVALPSSLNVKKYTNCASSFISPQISALVAEEGSYITLNDRRTFFSIKQKGFSQFIPEGQEVNHVYYIHNGVELPVFCTLNGFSILSSDIIDNPSSVVMTINDDIKLPLSEIATKKDAILYVDLRECESIYFGYNRISFVDMTKQKVLRVFEFCANENITIKKIDYSFAGKKADVAIYGQETPVEAIMAADREMFQFKFFDEDYVQYLPNIAWRIDKNVWNYGCIEETIWHEEEMLHNNCVIEVENHSNKSIEVFANEKALELSDDNIFKLGDMLTDLEDSDLVTVTMKIGTDRYEIMKIANQEILEDFDIDVETRTATILPYFTGGEGNSFVIDLEGEESYSLELDDSFHFDADIKDNYYDVTISIKDFFGDKKVLLEWEDVVVGNPDKVAFIDRYIELKQFRSPAGEKIRLSDAVITDIKYLRNEGYTAVYSGQISIAKKSVPVEVHVRDEQVLSIYYVEGENFRAMAYDLTRKMFTQKEPDGEKIIPSSTCYYKSREV